MNDKTIIKTQKAIYPQIYAFTLPNDVTKQGWVKIGYTTRKYTDDRIREMTSTLDVEYRKLWDGKAEFSYNHKNFKDYDLHRYLEVHKKRKRGSRERSEWFYYEHDIYEPGKTDYESEADYINFTKCRHTSENLIQPTYTLREEQRKAVNLTKRYIAANPQGKYLWNAKPRFGKTLTAYDLIQKLKYKRVLILTNRPSVGSSWFEDFQKFIDYESSSYRFVSHVDSLANTAALTYEKFQDSCSDRRKLKMIAFISLQDLKGAEYFGGTHKKLEWVGQEDWDLVIVDESHEGVDTAPTDYALDKIKRNFTLYLSGTPYKALLRDDFSEKQIFTWTYADEQEAKLRAESQLTRTDGSNPYIDLPEMRLFTYQMSPMIRELVQEGVEVKGDIVAPSFEMNEFFRVVNGEFFYKSSIIKWLDSLSTQEKYPFSEVFRDELKHTLWLVGSVKAAQALEKLLKEHEIFKDYHVMNVAGSSDVEEETERNRSRALQTVRSGIKSHDRTITLSVRRLTTGVTVPEWTAVLMLSNMKSPEAYIQAAFRSQTPWVYTDEKGQTYRKENAYIFDFDPVRVLEIYKDVALYWNHQQRNGSDREVKNSLRKILNFLPVIAEDEEGKMIELDAAQVLSIPKYLQGQRAVAEGFMSAFLFPITEGVESEQEIVSILEKLPAMVNGRERSGSRRRIPTGEDEADSEFGPKVPEEDGGEESPRTIPNSEEEDTPDSNYNNDEESNSDEDTPNSDEKFEEHEREKLQNELKARLMGFTKTIPMLLLAYGKEKMRFADLETVNPHGFQEVTGITIEEFKELRKMDNVFDEAVLDSAIATFMELCKAIPSFLDDNKEDIFKYIPANSRNQVFTPKSVAKMMVDKMVEEDPNLFKDSKKTFADLYVKTGYYLAEVAKHLYEGLAEEIPDERKRLKHIFSKQIYGFAPSQIFLDIAKRIILAEPKMKGIKLPHLVVCDTLPYANGTSKESFEEKCNVLFSRRRRRNQHG